jgi:ABC-type transport system involved in multi-copper enzyme maturation permease subunit
MVELILQATISTTLFELRRSISGQKLGMALVLALFPPFIMFMIFRLVGQQAAPELVMAILLWLVGLLSLILWLPPGVYSELEGQTWILSTSRPFGRISLLLGKYASAVVWTLTVLSVSYALTTLVCLRFFDLREFAFGFFQVAVLAALAYGAVFSLLGVIALKRAMGFAVGYVLVSEILLASVPAMVQKFTIRYHLQSVGLFCISDFGLAGLEDAQFVTNLVLNEPLPLWGNYLALIGGSLAVLAFTVGLVNWRQLITVHES